MKSGQVGLAVSPTSPTTGTKAARVATPIVMPDLPWVDVPPVGSKPANPPAAASTDGDKYWVSFSRSDTPKAYELYSAYKTKAEAEKAAQDIRAWAARTGWKVADIQIEKDGAAGPPLPKKGGPDGATPDAKKPLAATAKAELQDKPGPKSGPMAKSETPGSQSGQKFANSKDRASAPEKASNPNAANPMAVAQRTWAKIAQTAAKNLLFFPRHS
jgi:hypothetical protein